MTAPGGSGAGAGVQGSVLLVDDDRMLLLALKETVARRLGGVLVEACSAPADALQMVEERDFDVVVTDLLMRGMHGIEVLERVRAMRPSTLCVVMTGTSEREHSVRALRGGAYDFIQKPVDPDYLVACIRRAIETRRLRAAVEQQQAALKRHAEGLEQAVAERTEELTRANIAKDEFLATMSHELRTPLTAILGWARLLVAGNLDDAEHTQAIESIARNARSQAQLIDDLLDVSRIITGKMRLEVRELDLALVIEGALAGILPAAHAKEIRIEPRIEKLPKVSGDAGRLQQVLWNLLSNAVKFTRRRGRIVVDARAVGSGVEIEVTDDGAGIAPEFLPHVFDRFRQGGSLIASRKGLGLGLAIARHLVELHGGVIFAQSEGLGKGATFRVALPSLAPSQQTSKQVATPALGKAVDADCLRGVRVAVVDDEEDTRQVLRLMLEHAGASVDVAASAAEAREVVRRVRPALLLCDIGLGSEDGYSLLRTLQPAADEVAVQMRAVALTAHARSEDRERALAAGFDLHIPKPGPPDLPQILAGLLRGDRRVESTRAEAGEGQ